jgi:hypothetical protein
MILYKDNKDIVHEKKYDDDTLEINLSSKNITQILNISGLKKLKKLSLMSNYIENMKDLKGLNELIYLEELNLGFNKITEIEGLDNLTKLQKLWLQNNNIKEIKGLEKLNNLEEILLNNNKIEEMKGLDGLTSLEYLWLDNNQITEMKGLNRLHNLKLLTVSSNKITKITGLDELNNLQQLWLYQNDISTIPYTIMNLQKLYRLFIDCNISQIIKRFLDRNHIKNKKTIYDDPQNVHDNNITKSIQKSIYNIISDSKETTIDSVLKEIISDKVLNKITKQQLIEYCEDKSVHSILNLTFEEVLCSVWKIISEHSERDEIKRILNEEMKDSMCKCFTGRLSRLVNCLNGFDDRVSIKIDDNEQILNVIIKIRNKYMDNIEKQKEEIEKELSDRGYDKNIINEYINYLE